MFQVKIPMAGRSAKDMLEFAQSKAKERKGCLIMGTTEAGQVHDDGKHLANYHFDAGHMVVNVLHKPLFVPQGLVERELHKLFAAS